MAIPFPQFHVSARNPDTILPPERPNRMQDFFSQILAQAQRRPRQPQPLEGAGTFTAAQDDPILSALLGGQNIGRYR